MDWEEREIEPEELAAWREATEVPNFAVAALQARVLAQVAQPRSRLPWWKWAIPVAAAAILVTVVATRPNAPSADERGLPKAPAVFVPVEVAPKREEKVAAPAKPLLVTQRERLRPKPASDVGYIRYETPDPDVVILLIGSDGGGE